MLLGYDLRLVPTGLVFDSLAFHRLESQNDRFPVTIRSDFTNRMPLGIICKDLSNIFDLLESSVLLHYTAYPLITIEKCRYFIYIRNQWAVDGQLPYNHKLEMKHEFEDRITAPIFAEESSSSTAVEELGWAWRGLVLLYYDVKPGYWHMPYWLYRVHPEGATHYLIGLRHQYMPVTRELLLMGFTIATMRLCI